MTDNNQSSLCADYRVSRYAFESIVLNVVYIGT